jgi:hypothetical protein
MPAPVESYILSPLFKSVKGTDRCFTLYQPRR